MIMAWTAGDVSLRFALSDLTLFSYRMRLLRRRAGRNEPPLRASELTALAPLLQPDVAGAVVWSQPVAEDLPTLTRNRDRVFYVPRQYEHFYVDLTLGLDKYLQTFSARSRSTLKRKLRKFAEFSGGRCDWRSYRTSTEIAEFYALARELSSLTYQERLLGAGLPATAEYLEQIKDMGDHGEIIGYLLFHRGRPVSYLLCPIESGQSLMYAYVGFDPAYRLYSPGTVLLWLMLESLQHNGRYQIFDFTEGEAEHKRLFSTNSYRSADIFIFRRKFTVSLVVEAHRMICRLSELLGRLAARIGLKRHIKRWLRG
jgi:CelD/BcsL family acetyltransferase involved in cellulose biosynthesis